MLYHCELAWLGGDVPAQDVAIEVAADRIVSVAVGTDAPAGAVRLAGLTIPGLANAHSHAFHRALRGRTHAGAGSFWTWREQMYAVAARLQPDSYLDLARAVFAEMVLAGITCVGEFHYLHRDVDGRPYADPNAMGDALLEAARQAGLRITLLDACYLRGGIGGGELDPVQRRFSDGDAVGWAGRAAALADRPDMRVGAAVHSVRAVAPADIDVVAAFASSRGVPLHAHVSEQPAENEQCLAAYGCSPCQLLSDRGAVAERFTTVHATHVSEHDAALLGGARATVCLCPTTERDLADGIGPSRQLRDAGARLALGTDSQAVIDLLEEARAVELDERLASLVRGGHDATSLLRAATEHGHASLGWPEAGRLAAGAPADLVSIRLDSVRLAGTGPAHALPAVVFAATAADVHHVVVGGRVVVAGGRHTSIDVPAALTASIAAVTS